MSVMRTIKVKETFKEWFKTVVKFTLPSSSWKSLSVEGVNDVHRGNSVKNCSRDGRGHSETRADLLSLVFILKVGLSPYKMFCYLLDWKSFKKRWKNAFYFILKALFVLNIFKILRWLFGHVRKTVRLER